MALNAWYQWGEGPVTIESVTDLDALLERMAADYVPQDGPVPPMIEIARPDSWAEGWIAVRIGLARDRGFIAHADADGSYLTTNGGDPGGDPVIYDYQGNVREFPADAEVPLAEVVKAAHDLITSGGERSTAVTWRPWNG